MEVSVPSFITYSPFRRILAILKADRSEITSVYFYAILNGLIQLSLPLGIQAIIGFVLGGVISTSLVILIALVVVGVFLNGLLQVNQMKLIEKIQQKLFARYSFEFANRLPRIDLQKTDDVYLPELTNRFFDVISLQKGVAKVLIDIPTASIQILFGLILLCFYHPIFIAFGLILIFILFLLLRFTGPKGLETSYQESYYKYRVAGWLEEIARIVKSLRFSKGSLIHLRKNDELTTQYIHNRTSHFKILLFQYWSLVGFKVIITAAMLIVGTILLVDQQINIGQFIAAEIVIITILNSIEKFTLNLDKVYDILTSVGKLSKVIDKPLETSGILDLTEVPGGLSVEIRDLEFSYNSEIKVLNNININIPAGNKTVLMGADGSGKSTLLKILTGAYQPAKGYILINGIPLSNYNISNLRSKMGIYFTQQDIFQGSLLENITMGNTNIHYQEVMDIANKLGLNDFLIQLPGGLQHEIDPIGKKLSRNSIQKILILRMLMLKPKLILMEESWSGIEESFKSRLENYLLNELKQTTMVIITNDQSFANQCDQIIHLQEGKVSQINYPKS
jgi:ABC-type bacteriocin/lantibiotic exporter with double-glycine peptidase domain